MVAQLTEFQLKTVYPTGQQGVMTFEEIYREYGDRVINLAYRMTEKEETARDLAQDVFIKVYENMDNFRGDSQVFTWIYRIATNHILNHLKKTQRHKWLNLMDKSIGDVIKEEQIEPTFWGKTGFASPDQKMEKSEREKVVWSIVQKLPVKYRVPFVLHRYEGMSYNEIADTMELSLSAIETRIHRAKKEVMQKLEPWLEHL